MNLVRMAVTGAVGFAVGAGMMLMPGNQRLKKQMGRQMEQIRKMSKMW